MRHRTGLFLASLLLSVGPTFADAIVSDTITLTDTAGYYGCATQKYEDASFLFLNPVSLRI